MFSASGSTMQSYGINLNSSYKTKCLLMEAQQFTIQWSLSNFKHTHESSVSMPDQRNKSLQVLRIHSRKKEIRTKRFFVFRLSTIVT